MFSPTTPPGAPVVPADGAPSASTQDEQDR